MIEEDKYKKGIDPYDNKPSKGFIYFNEEWNIKEEDDE